MNRKDFLKAGLVMIGGVWVPKQQGATIIVRGPISAGGFDADAQSFFTSAGITDSTQKSAVNQLVLDLKSASIWSKMIALYPFVGGDSTKHSYNLKNPATYQMTWSGTITHDSNGITGNGSSGFGDTGVNYSSNTTADDSAFGIYSRTNAQDSVPYIGAGVGGTSANLYPRFVDDNAYFRNAESTGGCSGSNTNGSGFFVCSRTSSSSVAGYRNSGTALASGTGAQGTRANSNFLLLKFDTFYTNANLALAFISSGLSGTEVGNFNTAVATFQTTLGRNV